MLTVADIPDETTANWELQMHDCRPCSSSGQFLLRVCRAIFWETADAAHGALQVVSISRHCVQCINAVTYQVGVYSKISDVDDILRSGNGRQSPQQGGREHSRRCSCT